MNTEAMVKNTLANTLQLDNIDDINMEDNLRRDLHLDSMSSLMFLMKLEENIKGFQVDPETFQMEDLETVSSIVNYVNLQVLSQDAHVH